MVMTMTMLAKKEKLLFFSSNHKKPSWVQHRQHSQHSIMIIFIFVIIVMKTKDDDHHHLSLVGKFLSRSAMGILLPWGMGSPLWGHLLVWKSIQKITTIEHIFEISAGLPRGLDLKD